MPVTVINIIIDGIKLTKAQKKAVEERIKKVLRGEALKASSDYTGTEDSTCISDPTGIITHCKDIG